MKMGCKVLLVVMIGLAACSRSAGVPASSPTEEVTKIPSTIIPANLHPDLLDVQLSLDGSPEVNQSINLKIKIRAKDLQPDITVRLTLPSTGLTNTTGVDIWTEEIVNDEVNSTVPITIDHFGFYQLSVDVIGKTRAGDIIRTEKPLYLYMDGQDEGGENWGKYYLLNISVSPRSLADKTIHVQAWAVSAQDEPNVTFGIYFYPAITLVKGPNELTSASLQASNFVSLEIIAQLNNYGEGLMQLIAISYLNANNREGSDITFKVKIDPSGEIIVTK